RKLDATEFQRRGFRELADQQGLGQPGDAHEERVPAGEQADPLPLDGWWLPDDHSCQFLPQPGVHVPEQVDGPYVVVAEVVHNRETRQRGGANGFGEDCSDSCWPDKLIRMEGYDSSDPCSH